MEGPKRLYLKFDTGEEIRTDQNMDPVSIKEVQYEGKDYISISNDTHYVNLTRDEIEFLHNKYNVDTEKGSKP